MAGSNYDPFSMRKKKTPDFPSVFGGQPGSFKPVQPGWEKPFQHVTGAMVEDKSLPEFPDSASGPAGQPAIPEFPSVDTGWQQLMEGVHARQSIRSSQDKDGDGIPDVQFANDLIGQLDDMMKMIDGIGGSGDGAQRPPDMSAQEQQHEDAPATRDRSWMFQKRDGWDGPKQGSSNYTPAPVAFNNTNSKDWGATALDQRPGRAGPAASTVRYYDRALARAEAGSKADQNRVARLRLRIQGRPTNG